MARATGILGVAALSAVILGWFTVRWSGAGFAFVAIGCTAGIAGIVSGALALSRPGEPARSAQVGVGLSMAALAISALVVAVFIALVLIVVSGAQQGG